MKWILKVFIFVLSFSLLLFYNLYDSNAEIYNDIDYRILETGEVIEIDGDVFYLAIIDELDIGENMGSWYNYAKDNNLSRIIIQLPTTALFYYLYNNELELLADNVFRIEISASETNSTIYFYGLNQEVITNKTIYNSYPSINTRNRRLVTNIQGYNSLGGGGYDETDLDNAYNDGYEQGRDDYGYYDPILEEWQTYEDGYTLGLDHGYSQGYDEGYADGLADGISEGYADGYDDAIDYYINNTLPNLLAQANQEGYNDGKADGLLEGYDDGKAEGLDEGYDYGLAVGILQGYDDGYDEGFADGLDETTFVLGSLSYDQSTSTDYTVRFSLPTHNSSTISISEILENVSASFSGRDLAIYTIRQPKNITYEYELRNGNYDIIEIMPEFDMILFMGATDEMVILLNGNVIKYYNNSMGIEAITLRYTGFPNEDYENGYLDGLNDGLLDGQTLGYMDGYNEARRELWTVRYELGYNEARDDYGYYDDVTGEWITASVRYMDGYYAGLEVNNSEAFNTGYNKGFREGSTDSFNANLSNWIVPAIVIVLFLGGAIVILNRRMGGRND